MDLVLPQSYESLSTEAMLSLRGSGTVSFWVSAGFAKAFIGASCSVVGAYVSARYFGGNSVIRKAITGFLFSMFGAKLQSYVKSDIFVSSLYMPFLPNWKLVL